MGSSSDPLALIAGSSQMPRVVGREARRRGRRVIAVAVHGITEPAIEEAVDEVRWLRWGDVPGFLGLLGELQERGVHEAVMAGKVEQSRIYDSEGAEGLEELLSGVPVRHTDALIDTVAEILADAGIELIDGSELLDDYLAPEGRLAEREPDDRERDDIAHGWRIAKALGGVDVGQSVVVKARAVVAIEAMEGTDACILRAGELAGPGTVVVKVAKPRQDRRFDMPVVGAATIAAMVDAGATVLAIEAGSTLVFDREELAAAADTAGIAVVARSHE